MVFARCRTERAGFSVVEAAVGIAAGALLLVLAYGALSAGSRLQSRAESKLASTGESELVFRKLGRDLSAALRPPIVDGATLEVSTPGEDRVRWTFTAAPGGRGSRVERTTGTDSAQHLIGTLVAAELEQVARDGRTTVTLALTARGTHDHAPAEYRETFFLRGTQNDVEWNPIHAQ